MNFSGFSVLRGAKSPCEDVDDVGRRGDWTALIMTHHNTVNKLPHLSSTVPTSHQVVQQERPGSKSIVAADTRHDLLVFLDATAPLDLVLSDLVRELNS